MNSKIIALFATIIVLVGSGCGSLMGQQPYPVMNGSQMPMYAGAPGAPMMAAPVAQNQAFLGTPVRTCDSGPLMVEIKNESYDQYVQLTIDGDDAVVIGRHGQLPSFVPPRASVFICIESFGLHAFTGTRFVGRIGQLVPAGNINFSTQFNPVMSGYIGHHVVFINEAGVTTG